MVYVDNPFFCYFSTSLVISPSDQYFFSITFFFIVKMVPYSCLLIQIFMFTNVHKSIIIQIVCNLSLHKLYHYYITSFHVNFAYCLSRHLHRDNYNYPQNIISRNISKYRSSMIQYRSNLY